MAFLRSRVRRFFIRPFSRIIRHAEGERPWGGVSFAVRSGAIIVGREKSRVQSQPTVERPAFLGSRVIQFDPIRPVSLDETAKSGWGLNGGVEAHTRAT
jgi:hypothetical protein